MTPRTARLWLLGASTLALAVFFTVVPIRAQGLGDADLYAYIYEGTCADTLTPDARFHRIGELHGPFLGLDIDTDLELFPNGGFEDTMGLQGDGMVYEEDRDIRTSLDQLTGAPHVVVLRNQDNPDGPVVACGEIAGETQDDVLRIELAPVGDSDVSGIALFAPERDFFGDEVEVIVQAQRDGGMTATPAP